MNPLEMEKQPRLTTVNNPQATPRPAVTLSKKQLLKIPDAEQAISAHLDALLTAMFDLALGFYHSVPKYDKETGQVEARVYEVPPDYKALAFLLENVMGKVPQRLEMTGDGGGPIKVIPWMTMAEGLRQGLLQTGAQDAADEAEATEVTEGEYTVSEDGDGEPS